VSVRAVEWAWTVKGLTPEQKLVLLFVAKDQHPKTKLSCPSQQRIADHVENSVHNVRRILTQLEARPGILKRRPRVKGEGRGRGRTSDCYTLGCDLSASEPSETLDLNQPNSRPKSTGDPSSSDFPTRRVNTLEGFSTSNEVLVEAKKQPDPRIQRLVGVYITEHQAHFGFRPPDADHMGKEIKIAFDAGCTEGAVEYAVGSAARDPFGARALQKNLRLGADSARQIVEY
jgi:hypothetical protein